MPILELLKKNFIKFTVFNGLIIIISIVILLLIPNYYQASVVLIPKTDGSAVGMQNKLGGLAALAGVNFGSGGSDKIVYALEIVNKKTFINDFVKKYSYKVELFAQKRWEPTTRVVEYDPEIYSFEQKMWTREVKSPKTPEPSDFEVFEQVNKKMSIMQDKITGVVVIRFEAASPVFAKEFAQNIVTELNQKVRQRDIQNYENAVVNIQNQILTSDSSEVKKTLYTVLEENVKKMALAKSTQDYVFEVVEPASEAEKKAGPARAIILIAITIFFSFFSICFLWVRAFLSREIN